MLAVFLLTLAQGAPDLPSGVILRDIRQGPMPAEQRTLSQPHRNARPEGTFPDLAVRELRVDGDTLYVLVANEGRRRAVGPILVSGQAQANGARSDAAPVRIGTMKAGEKRWLELRGFSVRSAASGAGPVFALESATTVSATVRQQPAMGSLLDRSGQRREEGQDPNDSNNGLSATGAAIVRGRPR